MAANSILNLLKPGKVLAVTEGLNVFRAQVPPSFTGKSLAENRVREQTGCSVIAIGKGGGSELDLAPDPHQPLHRQDELVLIGNISAEESYREKF